MTEQSGLYRVNVMLSNTATGSPFLLLKLVVDAPSGEVFGSGEIVRATSTGGKLEVAGIRGSIQHTGFGEDEWLVGLRGTAFQEGPPTQPIVIELPMTAALAIGPGWKGHGSFSFGRREVGYCVVVPQPTAQDTDEAAPKVEALVG
jgi:hypothetical protein